MGKLDGKTIIITGGAKGQGAAEVKLATALGAQVVVTDILEEEGRKIAEETGNVYLNLDVTSPEQWSDVAEFTVSEFGRIDGLINNAGGMVRRVPYAEVTNKDYDEIMDLNARSIVVASKEALPFLKEQGGFVINTTSIAARNGAGGGAGMYGSSKAFVSNVTRGMAKEWIEFDIRVNAVAPGVITTPFHERYSTKEQLDAMLATVPQGRLGVAEDCVGAYLFLASKQLAGYVIGQTIEVNGGQLMP